MTEHESERRLPPPFLYFDNLPAWHAEPPPARLEAFGEAPTGSRTRRHRGHSAWLMLVVVVFSLGSAALSWNGTLPANQPQPPQRLGIDLRQDPPAPKFISSSAEAPLPALSPLPEVKAPPQPVVAKQPSVEPPPLPVFPHVPQVEVLPQPVVAAPHPVEPTPPPLPALPPVVEVQAPAPMEAPPEVVEPVSAACYGPGLVDLFCYRDVHQGETPMLRNWNVIKWSSLLTAVLAINATPAVAQGPDDLKEIQKTLVEISRKLDGLKGLDAIMNAMNTLIEKQGDTSLKLGVVNSSIKELETQIGGLQKELEKLQGRDVRAYPADKAAIDDKLSKFESKLDAALDRLEQSRIAKSPPTPVMGRILLVNMYPEDMLFWVNGQPYRVYSNSTRALENQPAGPFAYQVISGNYGMVKSNTPTLDAGSTYTITVR